MRYLLTVASGLSLVVLSIPAASIAVAQTAPTAAAAVVPRPAHDSLFRYARKLVGEGNGVIGRALVDSMLAATTPGTTAYGDALYWHGALALTAAEAERDYRRVIVEYPLAYYADDALLAIAELEQARGDRAAALGHLQRFVHEHPASPARGVAALGAARLAFEQRDAKTGCAMVAEARASVAPGDVEVANQIAYFSTRCPATPSTVAKIGSVPSATPVKQPAITERVEVLPLPPTVPTTPREPALSVAIPRATTPAQRPPSANRYTIQLAAYSKRPDAERLVATLATRGVTARVSGEAKPFRVRLGFYPTPKEAMKEVAALKARGIISFVTTEEPPVREMPKP